MTHKRFEELVTIAWKQNGEITTLAKMRAALAAVLPLVRNEVIEECAVIVEDDDGHFTWSGEDKHVRLLQGFASDAATAIRALKTKEQL